MPDKDIVKDIVVGAVGMVGASTLPEPSVIVPSGAIYAGGVAVGSTISKKPSYLVTLEDKKSYIRFITVDKPVYENNFIQVRGFVCDRSEEEIIKRFGELIQSTPKELQIEILFPIHRIHSIRSLVYNAVKSVVVK